MHTYLCLYMGICLSSRGFFPVFSLISFFRGVFCPSPLPSEYIRYNRKLNSTFNFRFYMHKMFLKCDVTCSWTLCPLSQTVTPSRNLSPSSVTYFMDVKIDGNQRGKLMIKVLHSGDFEQHRQHCHHKCRPKIEASVIHGSSVTGVIHRRGVTGVIHRRGVIRR